MRNNSYIFLMRHATSENPSIGQCDFSRVLSSYGQEQIKILAQKINTLDLIFDQVLVSPSQRTKQTYALLRKYSSRFPEPNYVHNLYNACQQEILNIIIKNNNYNSLFLLIHNPGVSQITNYLANSHHIFAPGDLAILSSDQQPIKKALENHSFELSKIISSEK